MPKKWTSGSERARLYFASIIVWMAFAILRVGQALFHHGFLDIGGVKSLVGLSGRLRRVGWRLVRLRPAKRKL